MKVLFDGNEVPATDETKIAEELKADFSQGVIVLDSKDSVRLTKVAQDEFKVTLLLQKEHLKKVAEGSVNKALALNIFRRSQGGDRGWETDFEWESSSTSNMGCLVSIVGLVLLFILFFILLVQNGAGD